MKTYLLPGMGADHRMYPGAWKELPSTVFIDWPQYRGEDSITSIAARVIDEHQIKEDCCIGGSSLGGIVACEIARLCHAQKIMLIGSAKNSDEIHGFLKFLHPLVDLAPIEFVNAFSGKIHTELFEMLSESDPTFIRAMCKAIFQWKGLDPNIESQLFRIHGSKDLIIPLPANVDQVIDGGHLIAMTHPRECVDVISSFYKNS